MFNSKVIINRPYEVRRSIENKKRNFPLPDNWIAGVSVYNYMPHMHTHTHTHKHCLIIRQNALLINWLFRMRPPNRYTHQLALRGN